MKKSIRAIAATALITFLLSGASFAQTRDNSTSGNKANADTTIDEKNIHKSIRIPSPIIADKFSALFPFATNQQWTNSGNNQWVSFLNNGRKAVASFTPKGEMNYVITDCVLEQLPESFCKAINTEYASYNLFNAVEIKAYGAVAYQVVLENASGYISLKFTSEGVEEIQQLKKSG